MIVINGVEMDDGVDEPNERDEDFTESPIVPERMYHCPMCKCWHGGKRGLCLKCASIKDQCKPELKTDAK